MLWFGKNKNKDKRPGGVSGDKSTKSKAEQGKVISNVGNQDGQALSGDELRAQALANARAARDALGEDTINRVASILQQQKSRQQQLKDQIAQQDAERVADEILSMLEDKN